MFVTLLSFLLGACGDKRELNERIAMNEIEYYLENFPEYETTELEYGEMSFNSNKDAEMLDAYEQLEKYGYVRLELLKEKKKFLSRDSVFTYNVFLTDKAIPFVTKKTSSKASVKTFEYVLDKNEGVLLEPSGKNRVKATATLKQQETDFAILAKKNRASSASFLKKTYTFRFDETSGWAISR